MASENLVSLQLSIEDIQEIDKAIGVLKTFASKLVKISPTDRVEVPK